MIHCRLDHNRAKTQIALKTPLRLTLEFALVFLAKDEILEVTPNHLRLRKQYLTKTERTWASREHLSSLAKSKLEGKV